MLHPDLPDVHGLLIDLDGTLHERGKVIPRAVEVVRVLAEAGVPFRFVTNTTSRFRAAVAEKLRSFGFPGDEALIFSPPHTAAALLRARDASVHLLLPDVTLPDFDGISVDDEAPDAVVLGDLGTDWTFERLNRAFRLVHAGAALGALGRTRYWQAEDGLQLDVGAFVRTGKFRKADLDGELPIDLVLDSVADLIR